MQSELRARFTYLALAMLTVVLGLTVHFHGSALAPAVRDVLGDALWAVMIVWGVSALVPMVPLRLRGAVALAICWVVEFSQLYHAPAIDALRASTLGSLVLGSGFDPRDLVAYVVGVLLAVALEVITRVGRARMANAHRRAVIQR